MALNMGSDQLNEISDQQVHRLLKADVAEELTPWSTTYGAGRRPRLGDHVAVAGRCGTVEEDASHSLRRPSALAAPFRVRYANGDISEWLELGSMALLPATHSLVWREPVLAHLLWWAPQHRLGRSGPGITLPTLQRRMREAAVGTRARLDGSRAARQEAAVARLAAGVSRVRTLLRQRQEITREAVDGAQAEPDGTRGDSSKLRELLALLEERIPADEKVVVASNFAEALPMLATLLASRGIKSVALGGASSSRASAQSTFRDDPRTRVFLLHAATTSGATGSGAAGLNLTAANHIVLLDELSDVSLEKQAIGRVCRFGQTKPTCVWHLLAEGSIDEPLRRRAECLAADGAAASSTDATVNDEGIREALEEAASRVAAVRAARRAAADVTPRLGNRGNPSPAAASNSKGKRRICSPSTSAAPAKRPAPAGRRRLRSSESLA